MIARFRPLVGALAISILFACSGCGGTGAEPVEASPPNGEALDGLTKSLKSRKPASRARAARTIGAMGPSAARAVPALTAALKDHDVAVRAAAAHALGKIGPDAQSALPDLQNLAKHAATREVAEAAIQEIAQ